MVSRINRAGQAHPSATANTERTYRGVRLHTCSKEVDAVYGGSLYTDEMREVILRWWIRDQTISKRGSSCRNSRGTSARLSRLFLGEVTLLFVLVYLVVRVGSKVSPDHILNESALRSEGPLSTVLLLALSTTERK